MTIIGAADLERLRNTHPHKIVPYLSVFKPEQLYCGTVTSSPAMGARQITVVNVSGSLAAVDAALPDLTVYVGTSCGDYSKSKRRLRSRSGQVLTLDENSVDWANGDVITVMLSYDLWSVFPYIDPDTKVFYKDYNIAYTDENEFMNPVAIMGPHQAKFLDGPTVVFNLVASDSYPVADSASITTYAWTTTGGSIANAADPTTTITFDTPGQYIITLTVTDSNANTQATRRVYFVHQRTGANAPYLDFEFDRSPEGSWDNGGWSCGVSIRGDADQSEFPDNTLCVLWAETFWSGEEHYIVDGYNIIMVGYIRSENVIKELDAGSVTFDIVTIHELLKNARCFSVSLEYDASPDTWWKMDDLTIGRAVHHVWRWHSTLFYVTDVYLPILTSNTELLRAVDDFEGNDLYSMVDNFTYQHSIFAHVVCNKYGQVYVEQDLAMLDEADRAAATVAVTLADRDRRGPTDLDYGRQTPEDVSHAIVSGTYFDGSQAYVIIAQAPGYLPSPWGEDEVSFERLVLGSQAYANMIAGRVIAVANGWIEEVGVPMAGNWLPALDIVPQNWVQLNVQAADTKRGIALEGNFHLRGITSDIEVRGGTCFVDLSLVPEEFGPDGVPGPYPDDWPWPDFPIPPIPPIPPWVIPTEEALLVRNEYADGVLPNLAWSATAINDPSSILYNHTFGDETTNLLAITNVDAPIVFVSDGISIFFHQRDALYKYRIWRHDIATGLSDYLEFPDDGGDAYFYNISVVDVNIVAVMISSIDSGTGFTCHLVYKLDFAIGTVEEIIRYINDDITAYSYFYTVQSTVNVYTIMVSSQVVGGYNSMIVHRHNWTTGVTDLDTLWENPDLWAGSDYGPCTPIVVGYEIYSWVQLNTSSPKGKGYVVYYNYVTGEKGYILVFFSGAPHAIAFYTGGYYADLKRIYFIIRPYVLIPAQYYLAYINILTKELTYTNIPDPRLDIDQVYNMFHNKNKCWRQNWSNKPNVAIHDLQTDEARALSTMSDDHGAYYYKQPKKWAQQVDDIDERVWSFQGHYIIGQGVDDVWIIESSVTAPTTSPTWDYREDYLFVLGRTFIVYFEDWNTPIAEAYVVHYPGSLIA
jgi:hypothetical protein